FSIAICIESVEPDLHPFKQRDALDVVDGDAVLKREPGVVGPQGKAAIRSQPPGVDLYAATCIGFPYVTGIASRGPIEFAIANGNGITTHVQDLFTLARVELADFKRRRTKFFGKRNLVAPDERILVNEEFRNGAVGKSPAGLAVTQVPAQFQLQ